MCTRISELGGGAYRENCAAELRVQLNRFCVASKSPTSDTIGKETRA
jgi:hypothetical protein